MGLLHPALPLAVALRIAACSVTLLLTIGLLMLWSASFPQSEYDSGYTDAGRYFRKQN